MNVKQLRIITHKAFAGFMALWLSGVVFLFCCEEINGRSMEADSCPLAKMSAHCDKANKAEGSEVVANQTDQQAIECCGFIAIFFDKTRMVESNQQPSAAAPAFVIAQPRLISGPTAFPPAKSYRSTALLRNNTFLKNRTFRI